MTNPACHVFADAPALARYAANDLRRRARAAIAERGVFSLVLTGGDSPVPLYETLANDPAFRDFPWAQTQCFFGDERQVPPDHPDSNFRQARETLFCTGLIPAANIHRIKGEYDDAAIAASEYEEELREFFRDPAWQVGGFPRFDVLLGGIGDDGHTSSLFAGSPGMLEKKRWVIANETASQPPPRITLTFPAINAARLNLLEVVDPHKQGVLALIFAAKERLLYPVQWIQPVEGELTWLLTAAVATGINPAIVTPPPVQPDP